MQESIDRIVEKLNFKNSDKFGILLSKSIKVSGDSTKSTYAVHDNILLKLDVLFKGFSPWNNEFGKEKKYESGVEALSAIFEELGVEVDKSECFILFHIRELGKFRMREDKLKAELIPLWKSAYKHYALEDGDFSYAIKNLMRLKLIDYRRGNLHLKPSVILRYKTGTRKEME